MAFQTLMDREMILGMPRPPASAESEKPEDEKTPDEKWEPDGTRIKKWDLFKEIPQPIAIVGIAGIYDLPLFYETEPTWATFIPGALGPDRDVWRALSPACWSGWNTLWADAKGKSRADGKSTGPVVVLAQSADDDDIEYEQLARMHGVLEGRTLVDYLEIHGSHDECWETGHGVIRAVQHTCGLLAKREQEES